MNYVANIARPEGDPKILHSGASSMAPSDSIARGLGWFSIALGITELLAARRLANGLGMGGKESMIRACGMREIGSGVLSLSLDKHLGLWSRVAGDGLDIATLMGGLREDNPKRGNVSVALAMVLGVTLLDVIAAQAVGARHARPREPARNYSDRSGFPGGVAAAKGVARKDFTTPPDMRVDPEDRRRLHSQSAPVSRDGASLQPEHVYP